MKLLSLEVNGFRGFARRRTFDLNADAVIVVGANGHGKTSLFDAVLWAVTGRIPRLGAHGGRVVSMYAESGQARVELKLKDPVTDREYGITRSFDGDGTRVTFATPDGRYQGPIAEGRIVEAVWSEAGSASEPSEALAAALERGVYLQQDRIRQFVDAASDQERFAAVSELVGAGRVTELQAALERGKRAWTTVTNQRQAELRLLRDRLAQIEFRLAQARASSGAGSQQLSDESWNAWWKEAGVLRLSATAVDKSSNGAAGALDAMMKRIDGARRTAERRALSLRSIQTDLASLMKKEAPDVAALRAKATEIKEALRIARHVASEEEARLAEERRRSAMLAEQSAQLRAFAALALQHLAERCPVCEQTYDVIGARARLERIAHSNPAEPGPQVGLDRIRELLAAVAEKEKQLAAADSAVLSAERVIQETTNALQSVRTRLKELGCPLESGDQGGKALAEAILREEDGARRLSALQAAGESLALSLALAADTAAIAEMEKEAKALRADIAARDADIARRSSTGELSQRVIEALREATSGVVEERLGEISSILQGIYGRMDPHPAFRAVSFLSSVVRGKGQLATVVSDPVEQKECNAPGAVLSSSQLNALAVSVFLSLNLGIPRPPLSAALLDDPLQSLDDVNLLGLVDLLRRVKERRQLLISTHDQRFGSLLARKLRPAGKGRTLLIELDGWSRQGPSVAVRDVTGDPAPLRLAAGGKA